MRDVSLSRRRLLQVGGLAGLSLPEFLSLKAVAKPQAAAVGEAKSCIVLFCWGGMSHIDSFDPKPNAPASVRGEFKPIATGTPGISFAEHLPLLARQTRHLAVVRSIHHHCTAHGKGMYWNMTGHAPPQPSAAANLPPSGTDWPSLPVMVSQFRKSPRGLPAAVRLPYPLVDNNTLQAGEYAGWMGAAHNPIVIRTPQGTPYGGVSRDLGSPVLNIKDKGRLRLSRRRELLGRLERPTAAGAAAQTYSRFRETAFDMLVSPAVTRAFDLSREPAAVHKAYGKHICGQSVLLSRRLIEAGVPIVTVCCAAGDLNGSKGDHWDTHGNNFNRLKKTMLPVFDRAASTLLDDLHKRGRLKETLVVMMGDFGRTPKINRSAGRDHYPFSYSVALAGGGIAGGQVYGSSDGIGAHPRTLACKPNDVHATIFRAMGIPTDAVLYDALKRPHRITNGRALPLF
ncbi:MAG: DUF1501 domain-containing protein [Planctomycetaceae bacterium]